MSQQWLFRPLPHRRVPPAIEQGAVREGLTRNLGLHCSSDQMSQLSTEEALQLVELVGLPGNPPEQVFVLPHSSFFSPSTALRPMHASPLVPTRILLQPCIDFFAPHHVAIAIVNPSHWQQFLRDVHPIRHRGWVLDQNLSPSRRCNHLNVICKRSARQGLGIHLVSLDKLS